MDGRAGSDEELSGLMRLAQAGDRASYRLLLDRVAPIVRRSIKAQRSFLAAADIEDLTQDVLLSVHTVRGTYDPSRPFMPWLAAIVRNRVADGARRHFRRAANEIAVEPETFEQVPANTEPDGGDRAALFRAIAGLPAGQRAAIEMLKLKQLSLKEASALTGTSVAALKVAVHRAMKALRQALTAAG